MTRSNWEFQPAGPGFYEVDYGGGILWLRVIDGSFGVAPKLMVWVPFQHLPDRGGRAGFALMRTDDVALTEWVWYALVVPEFLPEDVGA